MILAAPLQSIYRTIFSDIERRILSGEWPPGHRIPSEKELSEEYGCSRMTVNKALSQLAREGYIQRRRRAGSLVIRPHVQSAVLEIHEIRTEIESLGLSYEYNLIARTERPIRSADVTRLDAATSAHLLELTALHSAGTMPFCFEERLINLAAVPAAVDESFRDTPPGAWLLSHVPWSQAEHEISALPAGAAAAEALRIPEGTPCLVIERRTWNADHVVTFVRLTYVGASHSLVARFGPAGDA